MIRSISVFLAAVAILTVTVPTVAAQPSAEITTDTEEIRVTVTPESNVSQPLTVYIDGTPQNVTNPSQPTQYTLTAEPGNRTVEVEFGQQTIAHQTVEVPRDDTQDTREVSQEIQVDNNRYSRGQNEAEVYFTRFRDSTDGKELFETQNIPPRQVNGNLSHFANVTNNNDRPAYIQDIDETTNVGFAAYEIPAGRQRFHMRYGLQTDDESDTHIQFVTAGGQPLGKRFYLNKTGDIRDGDTVTQESLDIMLSGNEGSYINKTGSIYMVIRGTGPQNIYIYDLKLRSGYEPTTSSGPNQDIDNTGIGEHESNSSYEFDPEDPGEDDDGSGEGVPQPELSGEFFILGDENNQYQTINVAPGGSAEMEIKLENTGNATATEDIKIVDHYSGSSTTVERKSLTVDPDSSSSTYVETSYTGDELGRHELTVETESNLDIDTPGGDDNLTVYVQHPPRPKVGDIEVPDSHLQYDDFEASIQLNNSGDLSGQATVRGEFGDDWSAEKQVYLHGGDSRGDTEGVDRVVKFSDDDIEYHPENRNQPVTGPWSDDLGEQEFRAIVETANGSDMSNETVRIYSLNITEFKINNSNFDLPDKTYFTSGYPYSNYSETVPDAGRNASSYDVGSKDMYGSEDNTPRYNHSYIHHPLEANYSSNVSRTDPIYGNYTSGGGPVAEVRVSNTGIDDGVARVVVKTNRTGIDENERTGGGVEVVGSAKKEVPALSEKWIDVPLIVPNNVSNENVSRLTAMVLWNEDFIKKRIRGGENFSNADSVDVEFETWGDLRKNITYNKRFNERCGGYHPGGRCPVSNQSQEQFWLNLSHINRGGKNISYNYTPVLEWNSSPAEKASPAKGTNRSLLMVNNSSTATSNHSVVYNQSADNRPKQLNATLAPGGRKIYNDTRYEFREPGFYTLDIKSFAENRRNITPYINMSGNLSVTVQDITDPAPDNNQTPLHSFMQVEYDNGNLNFECHYDTDTYSSSRSRPDGWWDKGSLDNKKGDCDGDIFQNFSGNGETYSDLTELVSAKLNIGGLKRYSYSPHTATVGSIYKIKVRKKYGDNETVVELDTDSPHALNSAILKLWKQGGSELTVDRFDLSHLNLADGTEEQRIFDKLKNAHNGSSCGGCKTAKYEIKDVRANLNHDKVKVWEGGKVVFNASESVDNVGINDYHWKISRIGSDDVWESSEEVYTERFKKPGEYKAELIVEDYPELGVGEKANRNVTVKNFEVVADSSKIDVERENWTSINVRTNDINKSNYVWADHDYIGVPDFIETNFSIRESEIGPYDDGMSNVAGLFDYRFPEIRPPILHPQKATSSVFATDTSKDQNVYGTGSGDSTTFYKKEFQDYDIQGYKTFNPLTPWWRQNIEFWPSYTAKGNGSSGSNRGDKQVAPGDLGTYNVEDFAGYKDSVKANPSKTVYVQVDNTKPGWEPDVNTSVNDDKVTGTLSFSQLCRDGDPTWNLDIKKSALNIEDKGDPNDVGEGVGLRFDDQIPDNGAWKIDRNWYYDVQDGSYVLKTGDGDLKRTETYQFTVKDLHGNTAEFTADVTTQVDPIPPTTCEE